MLTPSCPAVWLISRFLFTVIKWKATDFYVNQSTQGILPTVYKLVRVLFRCSRDLLGTYWQCLKICCRVFGKSPAQHSKDCHLPGAFSSPWPAWQPAKAKLQIFNSWCLNACICIHSCWTADRGCSTKRRTLSLIPFAWSKACCSDLWREIWRAMLADIFNS